MEELDQARRTKDIFICARNISIYSFRITRLTTRRECIHVILFFVIRLYPKWLVEKRWVKILLRTAFGNCTRLVIAGDGSRFRPAPPWEIVNCFSKSSTPVVER
jgi:hypothetical protein